VGSLKETFEKYPNAANILPAMGYGDQQVADLEATINATPADVVVEGTPIDLKRIISVNKPIANISYELEEVDPGTIEEMVQAILD
jgi:predicted GTPase